MTGTNSMTYPELLRSFAPRPIRNEIAYQTIQAEVDRLVDKGDLTPAETDYLDLLGTLLADYERQLEDRTQYELNGTELIKGLIELHRLTLTDLLPIFKTKSIASAVLNRHRRLTVDHINRLAAFFDLPHSLFFDQLEDHAHATADMSSPSTIA